MRRGRRALLVGAVAGVAGATAFWQFGGPLWRPIYYRLAGLRTVDDALAEYAPEADAELKTLHATAGLRYPPSELALVAMKSEKRLDVWAKDATSPFRKITGYQIRRASGTLGPKLREGDKQVPEGVYKISGLNPNSRFHLSMELNYPNEFDRAEARKDGRTNLGGEIFIHGGFSSIGCLAMGDNVIERLFVLVARVGRENVRVVIAPEEPVSNRFPSPPANNVPWVADLHAQILEELLVIRGRSG
jgi:hypothetical protein